MTSSPERRDELAAAALAPAKPDTSTAASSHLRSYSFKRPVIAVRVPAKAGLCG